MSIMYNAQVKPKRNKNVSTHNKKLLSKKSKETVRE